MDKAQIPNLRIESIYQHQSRGTMRTQKHKGLGKVKHMAGGITTKFYICHEFTTNDITEVRNEEGKTPKEGTLFSKSRVQLRIHSGRELHKNIHQEISLIFRQHNGSEESTLFISHQEIFTRSSTFLFALGRFWACLYIFDFFGLWSLTIS
ncbi:hypothetical protein H5410_048141 [Solanum commersonii]|uniref:Uncharacterized protein n=1 Tax=Solanum commersonii TaxID=4109 RepID=A0A9J5XHA0_SOLCO|nr:hypothetical protein H5410_048141 [Solanum commersonii]